MKTVSETVRRRIEMQGFACLSDRRLAEVAVWLKFSPAVCVLWAAIGTFMGSATVIWALVPFAALGVVLPVHPFDLIYNYGIRHLTGTAPIPRYNAPRRFACAVASLWLGVTGWALYTGAGTLGTVLGGLFVVTASIPVATDFCVPSFVFGALFGRREPERCELETV